MARDPGKASVGDLEAALAALPYPVFILKAVRDPAGAIEELKYAYVNQSVVRLLDRPPEEVIGRGLGELFPSVRELGIFDAYIGVIDSGSPASYDTPWFQENGVQGVFWITAVRFGDGVLVSARDITEQRQAEMAHAESSRQYRLLAENASDFVVQASLDGVISWVSPSVSRTLGWVPADLIGTQLAALVHPDDAGTLTPQRETTPGGQETTEPAGTVVVRMLTKFGKHRWMSGVATPVADESGVEVGVVAGLRDVDELVQAREAAQADRAALRATVDSLLDPHIVLDAIRDETGHIVDFVYIDANPAACVYNKLDRGEMVGTRLLDLFGGHAGTETLEAYRQVVETGEPIRLDDVVYTHEILESQRRYDIRAARVGDGLSLTWRDGTDRYAAAQRLAVSEEQYRVLAENASDVVMRLGPELRFEWVSGSVAHVLGWHAPDLVGHPIVEFVHPEDLTRFPQAFTDAVPGSAAGVEFRFRRSDGDYRWVASRARVTLAEDGTPVAVVGGLVDVADRKAAEAKELHRLEELERFQRITVGRELKMIELKKEIEHLRKLVPAAGVGAGDPSRDMS